MALYSLLGVWNSEILGILLILEELFISNLYEYMQKAATALKAWACSENCESDYPCGWCLYFNCLQPFHSVFDSDKRYLNKTQNCVIKYLHIHSLWRDLEAKRHLCLFQ